MFIFLFWGSEYSVSLGSWEDLVAMLSGGVHVRGRTSTWQEESKEQVGLTHSQVFSKEGIQSREALSTSQIAPTFPVATGSRTRA